MRILYIEYIFLWYVSRIDDMVEGLCRKREVQAFGLNEA